MEQHMEILTHLLQSRVAKIEITFPGLDLSPQTLVQTAALRALSSIQTILRDDSLRDDECFYQIEAIVSELEKIGLGCGNRHDFG